MVERRYDANGQHQDGVGSRRAGHCRWRGAMMSVAEGHGPVNALDHGAAKGSRQVPGRDRRPRELADYKVRILNGGTEAITRVLIESHR
jgi:2-isopropylmalate synthase